MNRPAPAALSCREMVELVTDYLEGALSPSDAARFDAHLDACDGCTRYVEQMRATIAALGHLPFEALSGEAERHLLDAFRDWRSHRA